MFKKKSASMKVNGSAQSERVTGTCECQMEANGSLMGGATPAG
jgi:hypothetical protein